MWRNGSTHPFREIAPTAVLQRKALDGGEALIALIDLPGVASVSEVEVDVSSLEASVRVPGKYHAQLALPSPVDSAAVKAKFSKTKSQLTLTMRCL